MMRQSIDKLDENKKKIEDEVAATSIVECKYYKCQLNATLIINSVGLIE